MKIVCWNINGFRAIVKKGFFGFLKDENPDIICLQEIKASREDLGSELEKYALDVKDYKVYVNPGEIRGYSGVCVLSKLEPIYVKTEIGIPKYDREGRILELGFKDFVLFNVYFPNGQKDETRLNYKLEFYRDFFEYCDILKVKGQKIVICGDYNTAHKEIDLARPKGNQDYSGFLPIERKCLDKIVDDGYVDAFRYFDKSPNKYTWWSYMFNARSRNVGWRVDYFFVTKNMLENIKNSYILDQVFGSDHCPICLDLKI